MTDDRLYPVGIQPLKGPVVKTGTTYKCEYCSHQYSPHLAKKCPKCGWKYIVKHLNMTTAIKHFNVVVTKTTDQSKRFSKALDKSKGKQNESMD